MNEKSVLPLKSYSAYSPPFQYSGCIEMQLNFSKICQNKLSARPTSIPNSDETILSKLSLESTYPEIFKLNKKLLIPKQYIFGEDNEDINFNKSSHIQKAKKRKILSLVDTTLKNQAEIPDLLILKSPINILNRYISPFVRDIRGTPKSLRENSKDQKAKRKHVDLPVLIEDDHRKLKEFLFDYFIKSLQASNGIYCFQNDLKGYKFYVGPGNNSELVAKIIRTRPWWNRVEFTREAHFVWTSTRHKKTLKNLPVGSDSKFLVLEADHKEIPQKKTIQIEKCGYGLITYSQSFLNLMSQDPMVFIPNKMHNRLEFNKHLCSKKNLFKNLKNYYETHDKNPFEVLPLTFHIKDGEEDKNFAKFKTSYFEILKNLNEKIWIIKPGENTNRGKGIQVLSSINDIQDMISSNKKHRTYIIQKYIEKPLLINKRKFDIRCFGLLTSINSNIQGYFYPEGYIRTSSKEFSIKNFNKYIHLTNDAIQKNSEEYGKFEAGNKISYYEFQEYLDQYCLVDNISFERDINSQIRNIITDTFKACYALLDPNKRQHSFELLGYDFMVDMNFKVWLIEVNTNPCLELSCPYLGKLIPSVLDNTFRITLDQVFNIPTRQVKFQKWIGEAIISNKFELVFSENRVYNT